MAENPCPNCGHRNPAKASFCVECGQSLPAGLVCTECGYEGNHTTAAFCVNCGAPLSAPRRRRILPVLALLVGGGTILLIAGLLVLGLAGLLGRWTDLDLVLPRRDKRVESDATPTTSPAAETIPTHPPSVARATETPTPKPPEETPSAAATATDARTPAATPTPKATPTPASTSTATAMPTSTATPTRTPTPTNTPAPTPCGLPVYEAFRNQWRPSLGCPTTVGRDGVFLATQNFERGRMLWREDNRRIYALGSNHRWSGYDDTWSEGQPEYSCGSHSTPPTPKRGFGKVWCEHESVRQAVGQAVSDEHGAYGTVQDFVNGAIMRTGDGRTYVLLGDGTWQE